MPDKIETIIIKNFIYAYPELNDTQLFKLIDSKVKMSITVNDIRKSRKTPLKARQIIDIKDQDSERLKCQVKREALCEECSRKGKVGCPNNVK